MNTAKTFGEIYKGPDHIAFDITNRCNLNCRHCYNRSSTGGGVDIVGNEIGRERLIRFADEIKAVEPYSFCFCGGEPLLRLDEIILMMRRLRNPITRVGLVSNGYLLTQETALRLVESGIHTVQISIDGATDRTHERLRGVQGAYKHAIAAIKFCYQAGVANRAVAFCPTAYNIDEFPEMVKQMRDLNVDEIRVQPLMRLGNACQNPEIIPSEEQYRDLREKIKRCTLAYQGLKIEWGDPIDHLFRSNEVISEFVPYLTIRSNGDIVLSPYLPITIGNINSHTVKEYWEAKIWRIWEIGLFKEIAGHFVCPGRMTSDNKTIPRIFYEENVRFDLIDDRLLSLSSSQVYDLYWQRLALRETDVDKIFQQSASLSFGDEKTGETIQKTEREQNCFEQLSGAIAPLRNETIVAVEIPEQGLDGLLNFYARADLRSVYVRSGCDVAPGQYGTVTRMRMFNGTHRYIGIFSGNVCIGVLCFATDSSLGSDAYCESIILDRSQESRDAVASCIRRAVGLMHPGRIFLVLHGDFSAHNLLLAAGFTSIATLKPTVAGSSGFEILRYSDGEM